MKTTRKEVEKEQKKNEKLFPLFFLNVLSVPLKHNKSRFFYYIYLVLISESKNGEARTLNEQQKRKYIERMRYQHLKLMIMAGINGELLKE